MTPPIEPKSSKSAPPAKGAGIAGTAKLIADLNAAGVPLTAPSILSPGTAQRIRDLAPRSPVIDEIRRTLERSQQMEAISARAAELALRPVPPSPELQTARGVRDQTARLVELTTATGEHIADMAEIASTTLAQLAEMQLTAAEALEESRQVRITLAKESQDQRRAGNIIIGLTLVIAVLTLVLALQALRWWPFING
jgi:hypothetical protein